MYVSVDHLRYRAYIEDCDVAYIPDSYLIVCRV